MNRPKRDSLDLPWRGGDTCPCGSGLQYSHCCLATDGLPLVKVPSLRPPGPRTGFVHPKCFMADTHNCSHKISGEHPISQSILAQIGSKIRVGGLPWLKPDETRDVGLASLVTKVLCQRHNSALSPLDTAAGKVFSTFSHALDYAKRRSLSSKTKFFLLSGDAFEAWGIKSMLAMQAGGWFASNGQGLVDAFHLDHNTAIGVLSEQPLLEPRGLYLTPTVGLKYSSNNSFAPLLSVTERILAGFQIKFSDIQIEFILDPKPANPKFFQGNIYYRPWVFDVVGPKRTCRIIFTWSRNRSAANRIAMGVHTHPKGIIPARAL